MYSTSRVLCLLKSISLYVQLTFTLYSLCSMLSHLSSLFQNEKHQKFILFNKWLACRLCISILVKLE
jgi:hypothetical protein